VRISLRICYFDITQFNVEILIYGMQNAGDCQIVFELHSDLFPDNRLEVAVKKHDFSWHGSAIVLKEWIDPCVNFALENSSGEVFVKVIKLNSWSQKAKFMCIR
jgi:hypothetical protein